VTCACKNKQKYPIKQENGEHPHAERGIIEVNCTRVLATSANGG
jgi:hypothetical protein